MIDPSYFGCSAKLPFDQTSLLASQSGSRFASCDFSTLDGSTRLALSIDKVNRCAKDWNRFASIAINHVLGDVECAGARPVQALVSYEFGLDITPDEGEAFCKAFAAGLTDRGVQLGKCHSSIGLGPSAVTIAIVAADPRPRPLLPLTGRIVLSRKLGLFKAHYLAEMGVIDVAAEQLAELTQPRSEKILSLDCYDMSDVSGHGLAGSLASLAMRHRLDMDVTVHDGLAALPEVLSTPVDCLQNPLSSYSLTSIAIDAKARPLATLQETAGPFVCLVDDNTDYDHHGFHAVGHFVTGSGKVNIGWSE